MIVAEILDQFCHSLSVESGEVTQLLPAAVLNAGAWGHLRELLLYLHCRSQTAFNKNPQVYLVVFRRGVCVCVCVCVCCCCDRCFLSLRLMPLPRKSCYARPEIMSADDADSTERRKHQSE